MLGGLSRLFWHLLLCTSNSKENFKHYDFLINESQKINEISQLVYQLSMS